MNTQTHKDLGLPADFTDDDLAMLPEVEVAALREQGILEPIEPKSDPDQASAAANDGAAREDEPAAKPDPEVKPEVKFTQVPDVTKEREAISAIDAESDALLSKFDDGEISSADFKKQMAEIVTKQATAQAAVAEADRIAAANRAAAESAWYNAVDAYMAANAELQEPDSLNAFDSALKSINAAQQYRNLDYSARIKLAHGFVAAEAAALGRQMKGPAATAQKKDAEGKKAPETADGPRTDARPDPIQTLAAIPAAGANDVDDGRFAALDNAPDPYITEAAYARMSPEEQARYLGLA